MCLHRKASKNYNLLISLKPTISRYIEKGTTYPYNLETFSLFGKKVLPFVHLVGLSESGLQHLPLLSGSFICGDKHAHWVPSPWEWASQHAPGLSGSSICGKTHSEKNKKIFNWLLNFIVYKFLYWNYLFLHECLIKSLGTIHIFCIQKGWGHRRQNNYVWLVLLA